MELSKLVGKFKTKVVGHIQAERFRKIDFGIVKVALMVAALDGEIAEDEYKAISALMKKCRGYSVKAANEAMDEAMRSAGYLLLLSKHVSDSALVRAFIREAEAALPSGFAYLSIEEVRRAIVLWIAMGMSDGDYSALEKKCVEALRRHFAKLRISRATVEEGQWTMISPAFSPMYTACSMTNTARQVTPNFVARVESLIEKFGDDAAAERELEKLVSDSEY